jgi:hypothetical protein
MTVSLQSSMQFRRSGQRDERRRRLMADDLCGQIEAADAPAASATDGLLAPRESSNYGDAAFMDEQLRLTDLIPRRVTTFALLLFAALAVVAGLEALYAWSSTPAISRLTTDGKVAAFDLDGEGALAVWFSSVTLLLASLVALLVYTVRRHKTDDYRGYYRVWLWAALCWLVMSIDETSSLHEGFMGMMSAVTGTRVYGDGSVWWVVPYFFLLGAVGTRLLVDMRHCRLSSIALLTTAGCYALAVGTQVFGDGLTRSVMLEEGAEMVGNVFLLLAMGLHARYVILDAEGLLPARAPKSNRPDLRQSGKPTSSAAADWVSVDAPHPSPRPVLRRRARAVEPEPEPVPSPVQRKLTKQEKKVLRQRLMQERLQRERQQQHGW